MKTKLKLKSVNSDDELKVKIDFDDNDKVFSMSAKKLMPNIRSIEFKDPQDVAEIHEGRYIAKNIGKNIPNFEIRICVACDDHPWIWELI